MKVLFLLGMSGSVCLSAPPEPTLGIPPHQLGALIAGPAFG